MTDPTQEQLDEEKREMEAELVREASRTLLQKILGALMDHNDRHPYQLKAAGVALVIAAIAVAIHTCGLQ